MTSEDFLGIQAMRANNTHLTKLIEGMTLQAATPLVDELTVEQVAKIKGKSAATIWRWASSGKKSCVQGATLSFQVQLNLDALPAPPRQPHSKSATFEYPDVRQPVKGLAHPVSLPDV